jgi:ribosomal protein S12 methylthiotransferase
LDRNPVPENSSPTCSLVTLGCPKNLVDAERMLGLLRRDGCRLVAEPEGADFVIVNTCGFIEQARNESFETIREMVRLKEEGRLGGIIVTGCLAERDREALLERFPGIDQLVGLYGREEIRTAARRLHANGRARTILPPKSSPPLVDRDRLRVTPAHVAYLKISEGCDRRCTFCTIPQIRGRHVSKPIDEVVAEAEQLAAEGVRELILIGQDTTCYGVDRTGSPQLAGLLARLGDVDGIDWIRLMYLYPMHVTDELVGLVGSGGKILPYLDLPLQHVNDSLLRRMNRGVTRAETERLLDRLRGRIEGLAVRTTMIVGFPGETDEQFEELRDFVVAQRFERLGVFEYSREPGTPAARLPDQVPDAIRRRRRERLLSAQQPIAFAWNASWVGRTMDVLIDRPVPSEGNAFVGRSRSDAPDIDGVVYVTGEGLSPGQIVPCEIVTSRQYDLVAVAVGKPR